MGLFLCNNQATQAYIFLVPQSACPSSRPSWTAPHPRLRWRLWHHPHHRHSLRWRSRLPLPLLDEAWTKRCPCWELCVASSSLSLLSPVPVNRKTKELSIKDSFSLSELYQSKWTTQSVCLHYWLVTVLCVCNLTVPRGKIPDYFCEAPTEWSKQSQCRSYPIPHML